jgi:hypothetical protein
MSGSACWEFALLGSLIQDRVAWIRYTILHVCCYLILGWDGRRILRDRGKKATGTNHIPLTGVGNLEW